MPRNWRGGIDAPAGERPLKEVKYHIAPTDEFWKLREFGFETPDAHRIVCGQTI
jgi:hypothetical protein